MHEQAIPGRESRLTLGTEVGLIRLRNVQLNVELHFVGGDADVAADRTQGLSMPHLEKEERERKRKS